MNKIKKIFSTPKRTVISIIAIITIIFALGVGTIHSVKAIVKSSAISSDTALNFAYVNAGINSETAEVIKVEFDFEDGEFIYDIEFTSNNIKYEYHIKANDGTILKKETETINNNTNINSSEEISLEEAKSIALNDANSSEDDVTFTETIKDYDDNVLVYDIEFYTNNKKYEYEINATTGSIINKSIETINTTTSNSSNSDSSNSSSNYIGTDKAKEIAVKQAGLSISDVTFSKTKLEHDDGIMVYEIEFYKNNIEYECTINAVTGTIIEFDYDND